jgi:hypothetical protein
MIHIRYDTMSLLKLLEGPGRNIKIKHPDTTSYHTLAHIVENITKGFPAGLIILHENPRSHRWLSEANIVHSLNLITSLKWALSNESDLHIDLETGKVSSFSSVHSMPLKIVMGTDYFSEWATTTKFAHALLTKAEHYILSLRKSEVPLMIITEATENDEAPKALNSLLNTLYAS